MPFSPAFAGKIAFHVARSTNAVCCRPAFFCSAITADTVSPPKNPSGRTLCPADFSWRCSTFTAFPESHFSSGSDGLSDQCVHGAAIIALMSDCVGSQPVSEM